MNVTRNFLGALALVLTLGSQVANAQERTLPETCNCKDALGIGGADYDSVLNWDCNFMVRQLCAIGEYDSSWTHFSIVWKWLGWSTIESFAYRQALYYGWWYDCKMQCLKKHTPCKIPKSCLRQ
ncbi:hypothetical protein HN481_03980 [Candidatus Parcubacteria bacterium]|nr:hypothetical protein [Candidatus Parcubacteria bacterium]